MSEALLWEVLKTDSSKSLRRTHPVAHFAIEKGTLNHRRSFRNSGLARKKAVDVSANEDGIPVISIKNNKDEDARKPDKMWRSVTLSGGVRKALSQTDSLLEGYSTAMKDPAKRKVSALYKAHARKTRGVDRNSLLAN